MSTATDYSVWFLSLTESDNDSISRHLARKTKFCSPVEWVPVYLGLCAHYKSFAYSGWWLRLTDTYLAQDTRKEGGVTGVRS
ncbi:hypothetical protein BaRGS_00038820 [Batillaria attramentaria]|uniref:Uncharacterized protein n=1 Tax=Batillaria attramentaria TaxID=370345 RepID=A0ABD0J582_9CAEN